MEPASFRKNAFSTDLSLLLSVFFRYTDKLQLNIKLCDTKALKIDFFNHLYFQSASLPLLKLARGLTLYCQANAVMAPQEIFVLMELKGACVRGLSSARTDKTSHHSFSQHSRNKSESKCVQHADLLFISFKNVFLCGALNSCLLNLSCLVFGNRRSSSAINNVSFFTLKESNQTAEKSGAALRKCDTYALNY